MARVWPSSPRLRLGSSNSGGEAGGKGEEERTHDEDIGGVLKCTLMRSLSYGTAGREEEILLYTGCFFILLDFRVRRWPMLSPRDRTT